jgi:PKD repeat protein
MKRYALYTIILIFALLIGVSTVSAEKSITQLTSKVSLEENKTIYKDSTAVSFNKGEVTVTNLKNSMVAKTSMKIDDIDFSPDTTSAKINDTIIWESKNKEVRTEYSYNGQSVKEIITLKKDKKISFPIILGQDSVLIPFEDSWKIVNKNNGNTQDGLILERPFGVDASGKFIDMQYTYKNGVLTLEYNRTILTPISPQSFNPSTFTGKPDYLEEQITYPLTIDPTWTAASGCWTATDGTYNYVLWNASGNSTWTVPANVNSIDVTSMIGGGGGGLGGGMFFIAKYSYYGYSCTKIEDVGIYAPSGIGGLYSPSHQYYNISVTPGNSYTISVGGGGAATGYAYDYVFECPGSAMGEPSGVYNFSSANGTTTSAFSNTSIGGLGGSINYTYVKDSGWLSNILANNGNNGDDGDYTGIYAENGVTGYSGYGYAGGYGYGSGGGGGGSGAIGHFGGAGGAGARGLVEIRYLIPVAPTANLSSNKTTGSYPLLVGFTDGSTGVPTSWQWNFTNVTGNNTAVIFSTSQNPTYIFGKGNFSIKLTATNGLGSNTSTTTVFINVTDPAPVASFSVNNSNAQSPLVVAFTDGSTYQPTAWSWSFRNLSGNATEVQFSTSQNPTHSFGVGNYSIKLIATNAQGSNTSTQTALINSSPSLIPESSFTTNYTQRLPPVTVRFTDTSIKTPTSWQWNVTNTSGNNTALTFSTSQNPTYTFGYYGNYYVTLKVSNAYGSSTSSGWINTTPPAGFIINNTAGIYPLAIQFNDTSGWVADTWNWSFGDGTWSNGTENNVTHVYFSTGTYLPQLYVFNSSFTGNASSPSMITVAGSYNTYQNHVTKFTYRTWEGAPVTGLAVTSTGLSSTTPQNWFFTLFNINLGAIPITNTTLSGITDSQGTVEFITSPTVYYQVTAYSSDLGINQTDYFSGSDTEQVITVYPQPVVVSTGAYATNLWYLPINNTAIRVGANYSGTSSYISNTTFFVLNSSKDAVYQVSEYNITLRNYSYDIIGSSGAYYYWGIKVNSTGFKQPVEEMQYIKFNASQWLINPFHAADGDVAATWVYSTGSVLLLFVIGAVSGRSSLKQGILITSLSGLFVSYIGWLPISPILMALIVCLAVLFYMKFSEDGE